MAAHVEPVFLVDLGDAYLNRELVQRLVADPHDALAIYEAFLTGIASCIRARLVARAMDGRDLRVSAGGVDLAAWRLMNEWQVICWIRGVGEEVARVPGEPTDTAVEVVDTLLRLAAEWSER